MISSLAIVKNIHYEPVYLRVNILKTGRRVAAQISLINIAVLKQSPEAWVLERNYDFRTYRVNAFYYNQYGERKKKS